MIKLSGKWKRFSLIDYLIATFLGVNLYRSIRDYGWLTTGLWTVATLIILLMFFEIIWLYSGWRVKKDSAKAMVMEAIENKSFTIIGTSRSEIEDTVGNLALCLTDDDLEYIARKMGDRFMYVVGDVYTEVMEREVYNYLDIEDEKRY